MATYLGTVQLGGLYNNGTVLKRPTRPWASGVELYNGSGKGDIPTLPGNGKSMGGHTIGDTPADAANRLQWHKIRDGSKTLLICDRVILTNIVWGVLKTDGYTEGKTITIDGRTYKCRSLSGGTSSAGGGATFAGGSPASNEWDRFVANKDAIPGLPIPDSADLTGHLTTVIKNSTHNQFWHWVGVYSFCSDRGSNEYGSGGTIRGNRSPLEWFYDSSAGARLGWRPVLEVLNDPPTTPSGLTLPDKIQGGGKTTITWGASTDPDGNLEGYILERSLDGGSSWTQVYQGGGRSTTNTVPFGSDTVMYRVRAYDSEGAYSTYRTSAQVAVDNNTAPNTPGAINVPAAVNGGGSLVVTWSASYDAEGNLAGYVLERRVGADGPWTEVYRGTALSYQDTITKGWASVAYRVKAYDTYGTESGWAVSPTRTVDNNTAPTVASDSAADLGTQNEGFTVPYTVGDADGDVVTVQEALDGAVKRRFTAVLGQPNAFDVTGEYFQRVLNGAHRLEVTATDAGGKSSALAVTFSKQVTACSITLERPMEADAPITVCVLSVTGSIPADAEYTLEVTNNALDDAPVWEDCIVAARNGANHVFANQTAANGFAFNFRLRAARGPSGAGGYITSVQGGFQ